MADCRTAIAPTFTLSANETFDITFTSGASPATVTMAAGDYRMVLAPSSGSVKDYLRALKTAIDAGLAAILRSDTVIVGFDSGTGIVSISIVGAEWSAAEVTGAPLRRLGFGTSIPTTIDLATATRPALYLALFVERIHVGWTPRQVISQSETLGGVAYGIRSGITRADDELTLGFIPRDPTIRGDIGASQTALWPADAYVSALGVVAAREWSVVDVLNACVGQSVAFALGNWLTVSTSTTERYDVGSVRAAGISDTQIERVRDGWDRYYRVVGLPVTRSSTETRA